MRKLRIFAHISLDGVIQNSDENGFPYADWTGPYRGPEGRDALLAVEGERFDLLLLGTGKRFFAEGTPAQSLKPSSTQTTPTGLVLNTYTVTGPLPTR
jgi:hypothetical protein